MNPRDARSRHLALSTADFDILRAALLDGETAISAYRSWRRELDWNSISAKWQRVLPLLQHNMSRLGVHDPLMDRFRGVRRYFWAANLGQVAIAKRVFAALDAACVPALALKGVALIASGYVDRSIRPMDDVDILVHRDQVPSAIDVLERLGFRPARTVARCLVERVIQDGEDAAWPFVDEAGASVDLHWNALRLDRRTDADAAMWRAARSVTFEGVRFRVCDQSDQLLHVCAHMAQDVDPRALRWIADATFIIRGAADLDWERLLLQAQARRLSIVCADALDLLRRVVGLENLSSVIVRLRRQASVGEGMERWLHCRERSVGVERLTSLLLAITTFRRGRSDLFDRNVLAAFGPWLASTMGTRTVGAGMLRALYDVLDRPESLKWLADDTRLAYPDLSLLPTLGEPVDATADTHEFAFVHGWSISEPEGRWSTGPFATIAWRVDRPVHEPLVVQIAGCSAVNVMHPSMRAVIRANGTKLATWEFEFGGPSPLPARCIIPATVVMGRAILALTFEIAKPFVPRAHGVSADVRPLGLLLQTVEFERVDGNAQAELPNRQPERPGTSGRGMLTYAQNFEDVMLARLFQGQPTGFYVDLGAWHPSEMSITKHFYELGWSGINVAPVKRQFELFETARPRDTNLNLAVGDRKGALRFHECVDDTALSTADDVQAEILARKGHTITSYDVESITVDDIATLCGGSTVDFLKIDVEGLEERIIRSADWRSLRPRVLIIEATRPGTPLASWDEVERLRNWDGWEPSILAAGFVFAKYDGLNRFYLREEDAHLARRLALPPGVYDEMQFPSIERSQQIAEAGVEPGGPVQREVQQLRRDVEEKEQVIQRLAQEAAAVAGERAADQARVDELHRDLLAKEQMIQQLARQAEAMAAERLAHQAATEHLRRGLVEKEEVIQQLARQAETIAAERLARQAEAEHLRRGLVEKEEVIQQLAEQTAALAAEQHAQYAAAQMLHRDLVAKEELIQRLARDIAEIRRDREHRDDEIRALVAAIGVERRDQQNALDQLRLELVKKEEVIQALIRATSTQTRFARLRAGKTLRTLVTRSRRLYPRARRPFLVWARRVIRAVIGYRLGQFVMHAPRQLSLPARYRESQGSTGALRVSLVTPVFNQAQFIRATLESVLSQHYPALEYIVMDGGSVDGSKEIIEQYRMHLAEFESARDSGQANAINKGMARATGDVMAWLNGDDLLLPGALDYVAHFFERHPDVDVVYGNRIVIDRDGRRIGYWILPEHNDEILSWADYVPQETLFWRRRLWERVGGRIDESFQFAMDWDLLVRFRDAGARFARLPRYLGAFRVHDDQKTTKEIGTKGAAEMARIRFRCLGYLPTYVDINARITPYMLRHVVLHNLDRVYSLVGWPNEFFVLGVAVDGGMADRGSRHGGR